MREEVKRKGGTRQLDLSSIEVAEPEHLGVSEEIGEETGDRPETFISEELDIGDPDPLFMDVERPCSHRRLNFSLLSIMVFAMKLLAISCVFTAAVMIFGKDCSQFVENYGTLDWDYSPRTDFCHDDRTCQLDYRWLFDPPVKKLIQEKNEIMSLRRKVNDLERMSMHIDFVDLNQTTAFSSLAPVAKLDFPNYPLGHQLVTYEKLMDQILEMKGLQLRTSELDYAFERIEKIKTKDFTNSYKAFCKYEPGLVFEFDRCIFGTAKNFRFDFGEFIWNTYVCSYNRSNVNNYCNVGIGAAGLIDSRFNITGAYQFDQSRALLKKNGHQYFYNYALGHVWDSMDTALTYELEFLSFEIVQTGLNNEYVLNELKVHINYSCPIESNFYYLHQYDKFEHQISSRNWISTNSAAILFEREYKYPGVSFFDLRKIDSCGMVIQQGLDYHFETCFIVNCGHDAKIVVQAQYHNYFVLQMRIPAPEVNDTCIPDYSNLTFETTLELAKTYNPFHSYDETVRDRCFGNKCLFEENKGKVLVRTVLESAYSVLSFADLNKWFNVMEVIDQVTWFLKEVVKGTGQFYKDAILNFGKIILETKPFNYPNEIIKRVTGDNDFVVAFILVYICLRYIQTVYTTRAVSFVLAEFTICMIWVFTVGSNSDLASFPGNYLWTFLLFIMTPAISRWLWAADCSIKFLMKCFINEKAEGVNRYYWCVAKCGLALFVLPIALFSTILPGIIVWLALRFDEYMHFNRLLLLWIVMTWLIFCIVAVQVIRQTLLILYAQLRSCRFGALAFLFGCFAISLVMYLVFCVTSVITISSLHPLVLYNGLGQWVKILSVVFFCYLAAWIARALQKIIVWMLIRTSGGYTVLTVHSDPYMKFVWHEKIAAAAVLFIDRFFMEFVKLYSFFFALVTIKVACLEIETLMVCFVTLFFGLLSIGFVTVLRLTGYEFKDLTIRKKIIDNEGKKFFTMVWNEDGTTWVPPFVTKALNSVHALDNVRKMYPFLERSSAFMMGEKCLTLNDLLAQHNEQLHEEVKRVQGEKLSQFKVDEKQADFDNRSIIAQTHEEIERAKIISNAPRLDFQQRAPATNGARLIDMQVRGAFEDVNAHPLVHPQEDGDDARANLGLDPHDPEYDMRPLEEAMPNPVGPLPQEDDEEPPLPGIRPIIDEELRRPQVDIEMDVNALSNPWYSITGIYKLFMKSYPLWSPSRYLRENKPQLEKPVFDQYQENRAIPDFTINYPVIGISEIVDNVVGDTITKDSTMGTTDLALRVMKLVIDIFYDIFRIMASFAVFAYDGKYTMDTADIQTLLAPKSKLEEQVYQEIRNELNGEVNYSTFEMLKGRFSGFINTRTFPLGHPTKNTATRKVESGRNGFYSYKQIKDAYNRVVSQRNNATMYNAGKVPLVKRWACYRVPIQTIIEELDCSSSVLRHFNLELPQEFRFAFNAGVFSMYHIDYEHLQYRETGEVRCNLVRMLNPAVMHVINTLSKSSFVVGHFQTSTACYSSRPCNSLESATLKPGCLVLKTAEKGCLEHIFVNMHNLSETKINGLAMADKYREICRVASRDRLRNIPSGNAIGIVGKYGNFIGCGVVLPFLSKTVVATCFHIVGKRADGVSTALGGVSNSPLPTKEIKNYIMDCSVDGAIVSKEKDDTVYYMAKTISIMDTVRGIKYTGTAYAVDGDVAYYTIPSSKNFNLVDFCSAPPKSLNTIVELLVPSENGVVTPHNGMFDMVRVDMNCAVGKRVVPVFTTDAISTYAGYSGAPIYDFSTGKLIGIHCGGRSDGSPTNIQHIYSEDFKNLCTEHWYSPYDFYWDQTSKMPKFNIEKAELNQDYEQRLQLGTDTATERIQRSEFTPRVVVKQMPILTPQKDGAPPKMVNSQYYFWHKAPGNVQTGPSPWSIQGREFIADMRKTYFVTNVPIIVEDKFGISKLPIPEGFEDEKDTYIVTYSDFVSRMEQALNGKQDILNQLLSIVGADVAKELLNADKTTLERLCLETQEVIETYNQERFKLINDLAAYEKSGDIAQKLQQYNNEMEEYRRKKEAYPDKKLVIESKFAAYKEQIDGYMQKLMELHLKNKLMKQEVLEKIDIETKNFQQLKKKNVMELQEIGEKMQKHKATATEKLSEMDKAMLTALRNDVTILKEQIRQKEFAVRELSKNMDKVDAEEYQVKKKKLLSQFNTISKRIAEVKENYAGVKDKLFDELAQLDNVLKSVGDALLTARKEFKEEKKNMNLELTKVVPKKPISYTDAIIDGLKNKIQQLRVDTREQNKYLNALKAMTDYLESNKIEEKAQNLAKNIKAIKSENDKHEQCIECVMGAFSTDDATQDLLVGHVIFNDALRNMTTQQQEYILKLVIEMGDRCRDVVASRKALRMLAQEVVMFFDDILDGSENTMFEEMEMWLRDPINFEAVFGIIGIGLCCDMLTYDKTVWSRGYDSGEEAEFLTNLSETLKAVRVAEYETASDFYEKSFEKHTAQGFFLEDKAMESEIRQRDWRQNYEQALKKKAEIPKPPKMISMMITPPMLIDPAMKSSILNIWNPAVACCTKCRRVFKCNQLHLENPENTDTPLFYNCCMSCQDTVMKAMYYHRKECQAAEVKFQAAPTSYDSAISPHIVVCDAHLPVYSKICPYHRIVKRGGDRACFSHRLDAKKGNYVSFNCFGIESVGEVKCVLSSIVWSCIRHEADKCDFVDPVVRDITEKLLTQVTNNEDGVLQWIGGCPISVIETIAENPDLARIIFNKVQNWQITSGIFKNVELLEKKEEQKITSLSQSGISLIDTIQVSALSKCMKMGPGEEMLELRLGEGFKVFDPPQCIYAKNTNIPVAVWAERENGEIGWAPIVTTEFFPFLKNEQKLIIDGEPLATGTTTGIGCKSIEQQKEELLMMTKNYETTDLTDMEIIEKLAGEPHTWYILSPKDAKSLEKYGSSCFQVRAEDYFLAATTNSVCKGVPLPRYFNTIYDLNLQDFNAKGAKTLREEHKLGEFCENLYLDTQKILVYGKMDSQAQNLCSELGRPVFDMRYPEFAIKIGLEKDNFMVCTECFKNGMTYNLIEQLYKALDGRRIMDVDQGCGETTVISDNVVNAINYGSHFLDENLASLGKNMTNDCDTVVHHRYRSDKDFEDWVNYFLKFVSGDDELVVLTRSEEECTKLHELLGGSRATFQDGKSKMFVWSSIQLGTHLNEEQKMKDNVQVLTACFEYQKPKVVDEELEGLPMHEDYSTGDVFFVCKGTAFFNKEIIHNGDKWLRCKKYEGLSKGNVRWSSPKYILETQCTARKVPLIRINSWLEIPVTETYAQIDGEQLFVSREKNVVEQADHFEVCQNDRCKQCLLELKKKLDFQKELYSELKTYSDELNANYDKLGKAYNELTEKYEKGTLNLAQLKNKLNENEKELIECVAASKKLTRERDGANKFSEEIQDSRDSILKLLESAQEHRTALCERIKVMEIQLADLNQMNERLAAENLDCMVSEHSLEQLSIDTERFGELLLENRELKEESEQYFQSVNTLSDENEELRRKLEDCCKKHDDNEIIGLINVQLFEFLKIHPISEQKLDVNTLKENLQLCENIYKKEMQEKEELKKQVETLEKDKLELTSAIEGRTQLIIDIKNLKNILDAKDRVLVDSEQSLKSLEKEKNQEITALGLQVAERERALSQRSLEHQKILEQLNLSELNYSITKDKMELLNDQLEETQVELKKQESNLESYEQNMKNMEDSLDTVSAENESLSRKYKQTVEAIIEKDKEIVDLQSEKDKMEITLLKEKQALTDQNEGIKSTLNEFKFQLESLQKEYSELKSNYERKKSEHSSTGDMEQMAYEVLQEIESIKTNEKDILDFQIRTLKADKDAIGDEMGSFQRKSQILRNDLDEQKSYSMQLFRKAFEQNRQLEEQLLKSKETEEFLTKQVNEASDLCSGLYFSVDNMTKNQPSELVENELIRAKKIIDQKLQQLENLKKINNDMRMPIVEAKPIDAVEQRSIAEVIPVPTVIVTEAKEEKPVVEVKSTPVQRPNTLAVPKIDVSEKVANGVGKTKEVIATEQKSTKDSDGFTVVAKKQLKQKWTPIDIVRKDVKENGQQKKKQVQEQKTQKDLKTQPKQVKTSERKISPGRVQSIPELNEKAIEQKAPVKKTTDVVGKAKENSKSKLAEVSVKIENGNPSISPIQDIIRSEIYAILFSMIEVGFVAIDQSVINYTKNLVTKRAQKSHEQILMSTFLSDLTEKAKAKIKIVGQTIVPAGFSGATKVLAPFFEDAKNFASYLLPRVHVVDGKPVVTLRDLQVNNIQNDKSILKTTNPKLVTEGEVKIRKGLPGDGNYVKRNQFKDIVDPKLHYYCSRIQASNLKTLTPFQMVASPPANIRKNSLLVYGIRNYFPSEQLIEKFKVFDSSIIDVEVVPYSANDNGNINFVPVIITFKDEESAKKFWFENNGFVVTYAPKGINRTTVNMCNLSWCPDDYSPTLYSVFSSDNKSTDTNTPSFRLKGIYSKPGQVKPASQEKKEEKPEEKREEQKQKSQETEKTKETKTETQKPPQQPKKPFEKKETPKERVLRGIQERKEQARLIQHKANELLPKEQRGPKHDDVKVIEKVEGPVVKIEIKGDSGKMAPEIVRKLMEADNDSDSSEEVSVVVTEPLN